MLFACWIKGVPSNSKRALLEPMRELLPPARTNPVTSECMTYFQLKGSHDAKKNFPAVKVVPYRFVNTWGRIGTFGTNLLYECPLEFRVSRCYGSKPTM